MHQNSKLQGNLHQKVALLAPPMAQLTNLVYDHIEHSLMQETRQKSCDLQGAESLNLTEMYIIIIHCFVVLIITIISYLQLFETFVLEPFYNRLAHIKPIH